MTTTAKLDDCEVAAPRRPEPREAVAGRARAEDDDTCYWRAIYYGADYALLLGRGQQVLDAITTVVTTPEDP